MRRPLWLTVFSVFPVLALAAPPVLPPAEHPVLRDIVAAVNPERLRTLDEKLVGFGTRHTLSETQSNTRGIGAARRWVKAQFEQISKDCGGCLEIITPSRVFTGPRMPKNGAEVMDIVAIQKGTSDPGRYLVMTAHLDSRVSDIMNVNAEEPGADDDGSGVVAILETARILSKYKFAASIVYSADSGEEQGLYGGQIIADYARDHHWNVEADLNNDMIGNTHGSDGVVDNTTARIFSEAVKQSLTPKELNTLRYTGGFVDSPSREVARYVAQLGDQYIPNFHFMLMYRQDRFHRGGDQMAFNHDNFPAVRVNEAHENWLHQHQDVRVENGVQYGDLVQFVDFPYLAKMTAANAIALASMAWAPAPPSGVDIKGDLSPDTAVSWNALPSAGNPQLAGYRIYWRRTDAPNWNREQSTYVGDVTAHTLKDLVIDNWYFGVASVSKDGFESPVVFPGAGGAF
ncbi:MAG TPA: M28 family metallopeptidase [Gammaproteobacteria bacterium]|nr:M28 family metallopeptidase [Gammaproteobacteria bacterium]